MSDAEPTNTASASPRITAVDLFCGVGGKTHGFLKAGVEVVAGVDIDRTCRYSYEHNNAPAKFLEKSVADLSVKEVGDLFPKDSIRVLIGCAPCQPFSSYSYRYGSADQDQQARDRRWSLLYSFRDLVRELKPEFVTAENVPELALQKHQVYLSFIEDLISFGYQVESKIVKCADYGVPQTRERLVVLASRLGPISLIEPTYQPANYVTVRQAIGNLPAISAGEPSTGTDRIHKSAKLRERNLTRIRATKEGGGWQDWPIELRLDCHLKKSGKTYPSVYGRMTWDSLAPTLTTQCYGLGNGRFGHPAQDRAISLREAAILQTFPPSYEFVAPGERVTFKHIGKHIGNAVPVALGQAIGQSIVEAVTRWQRQAAVA